MTTDTSLAAHEFEPIDANFNWSNDEWSTTHLPILRLAARLVRFEQDDLQARIAVMIEGGIFGELAENLTLTKQHLVALVDMLEAAMVRTFIVLERLGYTPDNPPPDGPTCSA